MYMSTPENAWQILVSDTETDVSSYYVTLPTDINQETRNSGDVYDLKQEKLDAFKYWKEDSSPEKIYDADKAEKYPTLFDYYESEVYAFPPVVTGLDADYIIVNLAVQKLPAENIMDLYVLCLLYTSPSPRDLSTSRMPSSA